MTETPKKEHATPGWQELPPGVAGKSNAATSFGLSESPGGANFNPVRSPSSGGAAIERHFRRPEVEQITGLSTATIYRLMKQGKFPRPVKMSENTVAWPARVIAEYIAQRQGAA